MGCPENENDKHKVLEDPFDREATMREQFDPNATLQCSYSKYWQKPSDVSAVTLKHSPLFHDCLTSFYLILIARMGDKST